MGTKSSSPAWTALEFNNSRLKKSFLNKVLIKGGSAWHTQSTVMKVETACSVFVDAGSNTEYILLLPKVVASESIIS